MGKGARNRARRHLEDRAVGLDEVTRGDRVKDNHDESLERLQKDYVLEDGRIVSHRFGKHRVQLEAGVPARVLRKPEVRAHIEKVIAEAEAKASGVL